MGDDDAAFDVLVDLGGAEGEHSMRVAKASVRSAKTLRVAIAKAATQRFGKKRVPQQWLGGTSGKRAEGLAKSMGITLAFDNLNSHSEVTTIGLTDRLPMARILEASSIIVLPT